MSGMIVELVLTRRHCKLPPLEEGRERRSHARALVEGSLWLVMQGGPAAPADAGREGHGDREEVPEDAQSGRALEYASDIEARS